MRGAARVHGVQFAAPPVEQAQALGRVADLVAQIVRPAAVGVHVVEILVQPLGQQEADHVKILVVMGGQPARVGARLLRRSQARLSASRRADEIRRAGSGTRGLYGMIAVFRWPLWLIRWRITSSRLASGSSRFTKNDAVMWPRGDQVERLPDVGRRVVEAGLAGDLGVVQQGGVQVDVAVVGAAAEEVHRAAAAHHVDGPLPRLRLADRFDRDIHAAAAGQRRGRLPPRIGIVVGRRSIRRRPGPRRDPVASCAGRPRSRGSRSSLASFTNIRPMGPRPMIATVSPGAARSLPSRAPRRPAVPTSAAS